MKKILYIHAYFRTPAKPGSTRSYWFAKELLAEGYEVFMLTRRNEQSRWLVKEKIEGINAYFLRNPYSKHMGFAQRSFSFIKFVILATWVALRLKRIDLIYATSTPLTIGIPALICKWIKRIPFIFEVRDLWPEAPIQIGLLNNPLLRIPAKWLEKTIYKNAKHIVALSPGMQEGVLKTGVKETKVSIIPNMSKVDKFWKRPENHEIAEKFEINVEDFNVIHFGSMGIANGLEYIVQAAEILNNKGIKDIKFTFVGEGKTKKSLEKTANEQNLDNVKFIEPQPMEVVSEIVNLCDASIVTFMNLPVLETNSPNKLFDSLSAGLPVIVNSAGWTKDMVEKNQCGAYVNPEDPQELVDLLCNWKNNPQLIRKMGDASRNLAETVYDKSILCRRFIEIINKNI